MLRAAPLTLVVLFAAKLGAQLPLTAQAQRDFGGLFDHGERKGSLACHIETFKPFLDFSFRYEIGYLVSCPLKQFKGKETHAGALLRITPNGGKPVLLGQAFDVPAIPDTARDRLDFHKFRERLEFSGVFVAGEGEYNVDLVVMDGQEREARKSWHVEALAQGNETHAAAAMKPGTVSAISLPPWNGTSSEGTGLRLTVLLDAAPMNPYSRRLRAWDQAFLLGSLSSLLREIRLASVRLVAFNLDQQKEIFRDEDFDRLAMPRLAAALDELDLGTVSFTLLKQERGWAKLLAGLVNKEYHRPDVSDAVIFIGPYERFDGSLDSESDFGGGGKNVAGVPLFYLKYFPHPGADFPDAIQRLTSARNGTTFKLHSPGDLAQALDGLQKKLRPRANAEQQGAASPLGLQASQ